MKLSIIIPVYNEDETNEELITKVNKVNLGKIKKEIIVIDDGSKDETRKILKSKGYMKSVFLIMVGAMKKVKDWMERWYQGNICYIKIWNF